YDPDPNNRQFFLATLHFFGQPPKCEVAHTSLPIRPSRSGLAPSIWRQEGTDGTKTRTSSARICLRDSSCGGGDHPSDHDAQFGCAELVTDSPSSTFAFVLSLQSPTTGLRNESVDGSDCPTLPVEYRPSS